MMQIDTAIIKGKIIHAASSGVSVVVLFVGVGVGLGYGVDVAVGTGEGVGVCVGEVVGVDVGVENGVGVGNKAKTARLVVSALVFVPLSEKFESYPV
jgi:hypothetical protein